MSEFFWETTQKARYEYFCDHCGEWILPGETYRRWMWKPGNVWMVMRQHCNPSCELEEPIFEELDTPIYCRVIQKKVLLVERSGHVVEQYISEIIFSCADSAELSADINYDEENPF